MNRLYWILLAIGVLSSTVISAEPQPPTKVFLLGWDGLERGTLERLRREGKLPNFEKLVSEGTYRHLKIREGKTQTKGGWAQVLTGYNTKFTGVRSNSRYQPLEAGWTILERVEQQYAQTSTNVTTLFFSGKGENLGARGPHQICVNCRKRYTESKQLTGWWWAFMPIPTRDGTPKEYAPRYGEPYFETQKHIDVFENYIGDTADVSERLFTHLLPVLDREQQTGIKEAVFAFVHFRDPDEPGHVYGIQSQQYERAIIEDDQVLGTLMEELQSRGMWDDSLIAITTDHAMDTIPFEDPEQLGRHRNAPDTFLAINRSLRETVGDRRDITPTLLDILGIEPLYIDPPLHGQSLLE